MEHRLSYLVCAVFVETNDYTAVAVTRRRLEPTSEKCLFEGQRWQGDLWHGSNETFEEVRQDYEQHYDLIRLDRVQLHTRYTTIAKGIVKLIQELASIHREEEGLRPGQPVDIALAFDEGGVGKAVKDILVGAIRGSLTQPEDPYVLFMPVTVHGGANTTHSGGFWHIPKRDLVHAGIVAYQNGTLKV